MKPRTQEPQDTKNLAIQWRAYVNNWTRENFSNDESMFKNYFIPTHQYSSKGMTELQEIIYLIEQTGKIVFPDMQNRILYLMFDYYNIKHGTKGIKEVLAHVVKWVDTESL